MQSLNSLVYRGRQIMEGRRKQMKRQCEECAYIFRDKYNICTIPQKMKIITDVNKGRDCDDFKFDLLKVFSAKNPFQKKKY